MWEFLEQNGEKLMLLAVEALGIVIMWKRTSKDTPEQKQQKKASRAEAKAEKLLAKARKQAEKANELRGENVNAGNNEKTA